jgi:hypothetical protein
MKLAEPGNTRVRREKELATASWLCPTSSPRSRALRGTRIAGRGARERRRHWRPRPGRAVLPDLIKEPGVKAARQQPFDAIAAPEDPPPLEIAVFQIET